MKKYFLKIFNEAKKLSKEKNKVIPNSTTVQKECKQILEDKKNSGELNERDYQHIIYQLLNSPLSYNGNTSFKKGGQKNDKRRITKRTI